MNANPRWRLAGLSLCAAILLLAGRGQAAGDKGPWRPILPTEIYEELAKREADIVRERLNGKLDDAAVGRAKVGCVVLASLTMSAKAKSPEDLRGTRETALRLALMLEKKGELAAAKALAAQLPIVKSSPTEKLAIANWMDSVPLPVFMDHLRPKDKGGDGMHPDLQSNIRLKGALNSIEEKVRALSMKELTPVNLKKEAKELELLGYRCAVIGSLTYYYAPAAKKGKHDPQEWRKLSEQMRDQSVSLAEAAKKADAPALFKASSDLNSTCSQCHTVFR